ncbi:MAG: DUF3540 domain-containing protein [Deltaproteobacteria bacterium]|jgi:hypothetical protein|nr:DUF3540 domain-containing protein [Deltaproteobacteria bacterium]
MNTAIKLNQNRDSLAPPLETLLPFLGEKATTNGCLIEAQVLNIEGPWFWLKAKDLLIKASLAPSCFLRPIEGDSILCFKRGDKATIINILERTSSVEASLNFPAQSSLSVKALTLFSDKAELETDQLKAKASRAQLSAENLGLEARKANLNFFNLRLAAGLVFSWFRSFLNRSSNFRLEVAENLALKGQSLDIKSESDVCVRSESVDIKASECVKIDGQAVRLG